MPLSILICIVLWTPESSVRIDILGTDFAGLVEDCLDPLHNPAYLPEADQLKLCVRNNPERFCAFSSKGIGVSSEFFFTMKGDPCDVEGMGGVSVKPFAGFRVGSYGFGVSYKYAMEQFAAEYWDWETWEEVAGFDTMALHSVTVGMTSQGGLNSSVGYLTSTESEMYCTEDTEFYESQKIFESTEKEEIVVSLRQRKNKARALLIDYIKETSTHQINESKPCSVENLSINIETKFYRQRTLQKKCTLHQMFKLSALLRRQETDYSHTGRKTTQRLDEIGVSLPLAMERHFNRFSLLAGLTCGFNIPLSGQHWDWINPHRELRLGFLTNTRPFRLWIGTFPNLTDMWAWKMQVAYGI